MINSTLIHDRKTANYEYKWISLTWCEVKWGLQKRKNLAGNIIFSGETLEIFLLKPRIKQGSLLWLFFSLILEIFSSKGGKKEKGIKNKNEGTKLSFVYDIIVYTENSEESTYNL